MLTFVVRAGEGVANAKRHWQCASRAPETPLSSFRALPARAVGTGGDIPVVTATSGTDSADPQPSY